MMKMRYCLFLLATVVSIQGMIKDVKFEDCGTKVGCVFAKQDCTSFNDCSAVGIYYYDPSTNMFHFGLKYTTAWAAFAQNLASAPNKMNGMRGFYCTTEFGLLQGTGFTPPNFFTVDDITEATNTMLESTNGINTCSFQRPLTISENGAKALYSLERTDLANIVSYGNRVQNAQLTQHGFREYFKGETPISNWMMYTNGMETTSTTMTTMSSTTTMAPTENMTSPMAPSNNMTSTMAPSENMTSTMAPSVNMTSTMPPSENMTSTMASSGNMTSTMAPSVNMTSTMAPSENMTSTMAPSENMTSTMPPSGNMTSTMAPYENMTSTMPPSGNMTSTMAPYENMTSTMAPSENMTTPMAPSGNMTSTMTPSGNMTSTMEPKKNMTTPMISSRNTTKMTSTAPTPSSSTTTKSNGGSNTNVGDNMSSAGLTKGSLVVISSALLVLVAWM